MLKRAAERKLHTNTHTQVTNEKSPALNEEYENTTVGTVHECMFFYLTKKKYNGCGL